VGLGALFGAGEDDAGLFDGWIEIAGEYEPGADGAEMGCHGGGEGNEPGFSVAGFRKLSGLGDVFRRDEFGAEDVGEAEPGDCGDGGLAVRGAVGVGDRQALECGVAEGGEGRGGPVGV